MKSEIQFLKVGLSLGHPTWWQGNMARRQWLMSAVTNIGNSSLPYLSVDILHRECVSTGAAGTRTHRSLGHHLLHPLILRLLVLCMCIVHPLILRPRALFYRTDCICRSEFLTHALPWWWGWTNLSVLCGFEAPIFLNCFEQVLQE